MLDYEYLKKRTTQLNLLRTFACAFARRNHCTRRPIVHACGIMHSQGLFVWFVGWPFCFRMREKMDLLLTPYLLVWTKPGGAQNWATNDQFVNALDSVGEFSHDVKHCKLLDP